MLDPYHPFVQNWKELSGLLAWSRPDPQDGYMSILAPLEIDGVTIANLALRCGCYEQSPDSNITLQLEVGVDGSRTRIPLARVDWRPISPRHRNPDRTMIHGDHVHPFERNWLKTEQRMRQGNLPIAEQISAPIHTFSDLLDLGREVFRIKDIDRLPMPEWSPKLI